MPYKNPSVEVGGGHMAGIKKPNRMNLRKMEASIKKIIQDNRAWLEEMAGK